MNKVTKKDHSNFKRRPSVKPNTSNVQCSKITKINDSGRVKIEYYNLPSFKTDVYGNVYYCVHCDTAFYNSQTVKDHLGAVHSDFHYFCEYCGELFSIDWQLKRHQNKYTYNCDHCEYSTNHYSQFREHSSRVHKVEMKPKFRSENRYNKIYECDICGYQVLRPHMFKKHMKGVHDKDVE